MKTIFAIIMTLVITLIYGFGENLIAADKIYQYNEDRYGSQMVTSEEIRNLPMRGAGDSLHILQTLPGIGGAFSMSPVPIIRGMNPLYDRYYIDDIPIDFPYHNVFAVLPIMSSIPEAIIDRAEVVKGPHPLYYSNALGSIIDIKTKELSEKGIHGSALLDPIMPFFPTVSVFAQPVDAFSIVASGRRSLLDESDLDLSAFDVESSDSYSLKNYYTKIGIKLKESHKIYLIALGAMDSFSTTKAKTESGYHVEALKWEFIISKNIIIKTIFSNYQFKFMLEDLMVEDTNDLMKKISYNPQQYRIFQMLDLRSKNFHIKSGYEFIRHINGVNANVTITDIGANRVDDLTVQDSEGEYSYPVEGDSYAVFTEGGGAIKPFSVLTCWFNIGGRYSHSGPLSENARSYRANAGVTLFKYHSLYAGTGTHHSSPDIYFYLVDPEKTKYSLINSQTNIAGYSLTVNKTFQAQVEAYVTRYSNLPMPTEDVLVSGEVTTLIQINPYSNAQEGTSRGAEFFLRAAYGSMYGWISYSYGESRITNNSKSIDKLYSNFDQTHILKIVYALKIGNWNPAAIWHYYTPLRYTPITGSVWEKEDSDGNDKYQALYGDLNSERYSANHRLDLKLTYHFGRTSRVYAEMWNVYFQENYLYPKYDDSEPYSAGNPADTGDTPSVFFWLGMELSF